MKLKSKPHEIDAFQFTANLKQADYPKWFLEAIAKGKIQVTINDKHQYVSIYSKEGDVRKAYKGDWVCLNSSGVIFPLTDEEIKDSFYVDINQPTKGEENE